MNTKTVEQTLTAAIHKIAARPIRLDRRLISMVMDDIWSQIRSKARRFGEDQLVGTWKNPLASTMTTVQTPFGQTQDVNIVVTARNGSDAVVSAAYGKAKGEPIVIIQISAQHPWSSFMSPYVMESFQTVLMHELTHASDVAAKKLAPVQGEIPNTSQVDLTKYYNDPREVRAYMQEISESARNWFLRILDTSLWEDWGFEKALKLFLQNNRTWKDIKPYLTQQNHNRILKGLTTEMRDVFSHPIQKRGSAMGVEIDTAIQKIAGVALISQ